MTMMLRKMLGDTGPGYAGPGSQDTLGVLRWGPVATSGARHR